jgi:hypothetical protein
LRAISLILEILTSVFIFFKYLAVLDTNIIKEEVLPNTPPKISPLGPKPRKPSKILVPALKEDSNMDDREMDLNLFFRMAR